MVNYIVWKIDNNCIVEINPIQYKTNIYVDAIFINNYSNENIMPLKLGKICNKHKVGCK